MKYDIDKILKESLKNPIYPDEKLEKETISLMKRKKRQMTDPEMNDTTIFRKTSSGNRKYRPAAIALIAILTLVCGMTAFAKVQGLNLTNIFFNSAGEKTETEAVKQFSSNVTVLSNQNTFEHTQITPIQVVTDSFSTYILVKIEGDDELQLPDNLVFSSFSYYAYDPESDKGDCIFSANICHTVYQEENMQYCMIQAINQTKTLNQGDHVILRLDELCADSDTETMDVCDSGFYSVIIELNDPIIEPSVVQISAVSLGTKQNPGIIKIAPSGMSLKAYLDIDHDSVDEIQAFFKEMDIAYVTLQDGTKIEADSHGASCGEYGQSNEYTFNQLIDPTMVESVHIGDQVYYSK